MNTIAAISTPHGKGGVALIRISGPDAIACAEKIAFRECGKTLSETPSGKAVRVTFTECIEKKPFDDGLCTLFRAPHSFTGEDVAELCCHGGHLVTKKLLEEAFIAGASPALPGEFTKRAFQNGKISLSQAEAIGGIIDAKSEKGLTVSLLQCKGALSEKMSALCGKLKFLLASVYAFIDYPDEDMTDVPVPVLQAELSGLLQEVQKLIDSHALGKAISEGLRCAIVGKPNTGKSALLNALSGEERAIVTDIAGTTRDVIRETVRLGDFLLQLSDTAGLRDSTDPVEQIGISRSLDALQASEVVLAVFDGSNPPDALDLEAVNRIRQANKTEKTVWILNKSDLGVCSSAWEGFFPGEMISVSALEKENLSCLASAVQKICGLAEPEEVGEIVLGARQHASLVKARIHLQDALHSLEGFTQDLAGLDMEQALAALEEVDGKTASDEIVSEIFSHFCVGK